MTTHVKTREIEYAGNPVFGTQVPFESIDSPGCYICNWSGHLLRIPEDGVKSGRSPLLEIKGTEALFVTKICNDPFIPLSKARMLAADCDVAVNF
ncbi:MAG: hypothetical protein ACE5E5_14170 [Phycisphaerae bacterium]